MAEKNKGRNLMIGGGVAGLMLIVLLVIIGNVISIGDKIANVHPALSVLFYLLVTAALAWLVVLPVVKVLMAKPLKGLNAERLDCCTPTELSEHIKEFRRDVKLSREEELELTAGSDRKSALQGIIADRIGRMEGVVKESAVTSFVVTAISQNGSFDFISNVAINFRMINNVVAQLGRRPSMSQMFKLYVSVVSSSLVITALDDVVDDLDFGALLGNLGIAGKALNVVLPSALNGLMNAFVTLKVGYATIRYIEKGEKQCDKSEMRKYAIKSARSKILPVGKDGVVVVAKKAGGALKSLVD
ncbi:MAG: DUF697 domain-containing protein [Bacteroidaceae bacterium]|nr:DUF697 domain-containing protein [Bacteroidaceae bacterium]